jgi:acetyltransferase
MLNEFFNPRSVAVIGASKKSYKVGKIIMDNLTISYRGEIYPINRNENEINDVKCYKNILDVPDEIDLAIIMIPSKGVPAVIEECGEKGVKYCIIITSGFKEIGVDGVRLEREIFETAKRYGMRLLGPNCFGIIDTNANLNTTFSPIMPEEGNIAIFSQSGAISSVILDWAYREEVGFSKFINLGNKVDLNENDLLEALGEDDKTYVIMGYLEGVTDGERFIETVKRLTKKKPLVLIKAGRTGSGARAVSSHTGTLAGTESAYKTAFAKTGAIRAESVEAWLGIARALSTQPLPDGERIAIITNAGGPGIIAADACDTLGVSLAEFSHETIEKLRENLPNIASLYNPVDITGDADPSRYAFTIETILEDENVNGCIVILTPQAMTRSFETAREIVRITKKIKKPVLASFMGGTLTENGIGYLKEYGIPNYSDPEMSVISMKGLIKQYLNTKREEEDPIVFDDVDKDRVREILHAQKPKGFLADEKTKFECQAETPNVDLMDCIEILKAYKIPVVKYGFSKTAEGCIKVANGIGYPVVLKIVSPDILHKTDVGCVKLNIEDDAGVIKAYDEMMASIKRRESDARILGVHIQEMVRKESREMIIGVSKDLQFGHLIMFGMGGIYVEILNDVSFRIAPLSKKDAYDMLREIKMYRLLTGVRGERPVDMDCIAEVIMRISQLVTDFKEIVELDINPLIGFERGCNAMDVRMTREINLI